MIPPSGGEVKYLQNSTGNTIDIDDYYKYYSFTGPYIELIEEFTLKEFLNFHFKLKNLIPGYTMEKFLDESYLADDIGKPIKNFSSGMKLRLILALSFFADTPIVYLDEPTSNLDDRGVDWFLQGVKKYCSDRLLLIASNQLREYEMCENQLDLMDYK